MYPAIRPYSPQVSSHLRFGKLTPEEFQKKFLEAIDKNEKAVAQAYIDRKVVDINLKDASGNTPLLCCLMASQYEPAAFLLSAGADPNLANQDDMTPLMAATLRKDIFLKHIDFIKKLLNRQADLDAVNNNGETALILATKNFDSKAIQALLNSQRVSGMTKCEKIAHHDKTGNTALSYVKLKVLETLNNPRLRNSTTVSSEQSDVVGAFERLIAAGAKDAGAVYLQQLNDWRKEKKYPDSDPFLSKLIELFEKAITQKIPDSVEGIDNKIAYIRTLEFIDENI